MPDTSATPADANNPSGEDLELLQRSQRGDYDAFMDLVGRYDSPLLVDVRTGEEFAAGHIPGAVHIPLDELRSRLGELPGDQPVVVYCRVGQRGYRALRILLQAGLQAANLAGGFTTCEMVAGE